MKRRDAEAQRNRGNGSLTSSSFSAPPRLRVSKKQVSLKPAFLTLALALVLAQATCLPAAERVIERVIALEDREIPKDDRQIALDLVNPIASFVNRPLQSDWDFGLGPLGQGSRYIFSYQPIVPISLNKDWRLLIQTRAAFISQDNVIPLQTGVPWHQKDDGLGDIEQAFLFSPKKVKGFRAIGFGPVLFYPTATHVRLGTGKWSAGPAAGAFMGTGGWTYGVIAYHVWSYAGNDGRGDVSTTAVTPLVSYVTKTATTFGLNAEATYDWNKSHWTVPVNAWVSQVVSFGKMKMQFQFGGRYYAEGPSGTPEWGLRFTVTPLFSIRREQKEARAAKIAQM